MTKEKFDEITKKCQPHKVFSSDWSHYYSKNFADTMLPQVGIIKGKAIEFYDGADILPNDNNFPRHFLQLTPDSTLISLTLFSYPKGVKAEQKKLTVQPEKFELCLFFEIDINDKISIYLKSGDNFKNTLQTIAKTKKITDVSTTIDSKVFATTLNNFQSFFKSEYSHYQVLNYVGKMLGIDLEAQHNETVLKVHIITVKAYTSEPSDNYKRKVKETKKKYIKIDFEIINQPAINYSLYAYKDDKEIYQITILPEIIVPNKSNQTTNAPTSPTDFPPGKYTIEWDCTDNKIFDTQNEADKITIRIQAENQYKEIVLSQIELNIKELIDKAEKNNYIIILKPQFKVNKDKTKEQVKDKEVKVFANEMLERQVKIKAKIPTEVYNKLSKEEQLVIDLSIIMVKLNWLYSAYCQILWLEGSGEDLIVPLDFVELYERVQDKLEEIKYNLTQIQYASFEDETNFSPNLNSLDASTNKYLFDITLDGIRRAYQKTTKWIIDNKNNENSGYGNFDMSEEIPKMNFVRAYKVGSEIAGRAVGDLDDLGGAFGRFPIRVYINGWIIKQNIVGYNNDVFVLNINQLGYRVFDEFSFTDEQPLGVWKYDLVNVEEPERFKLVGENWYRIENKTFRNLMKIKNLGLTPKNFYFLTRLKILSVPDDINPSLDIPFYL